MSGVLFFTERPQRSSFSLRIVSTVILYESFEDYYDCHVNIINLCPKRVQYASNVLYCTCYFSSGRLYMYDTT